MDVPEVMTELEAKIFCEKRFRKRRAFVPSEKLVSVDGAIVLPRVGAYNVVAVMAVVVAFVRIVCPETVRVPSVPTLVRDDVTTVPFSVVPVNVPAGAAFKVARVP